MNQQENAALTERAARRALYSSLFSIVACAIMLFGTTFAWFTANQTSGVNTMTAANFDVSVSVSESGDISNITGNKIVTLKRTGGTAPGYCRFILTLSGSYTETQTIQYSDGSAGDSSDEPVTLSEIKTCYANFGGDANETISFRLNLIGDAKASISAVKSSWGSPNDTENTDPAPIVLRTTKSLRMSAAPVENAQSEETEIFDGLVINFGEEDRTVSVPASPAQETAKTAGEKAAAAAEANANAQNAAAQAQSAKEVAEAAKAAAEAAKAAAEAEGATEEEKQAAEEAAAAAQAAAETAAAAQAASEAQAAEAEAASAAAEEAAAAAAAAAAAETAPPQPENPTPSGTDENPTPSGTDENPTPSETVVKEEIAQSNSEG